MGSPVSSTADLDDGRVSFESLAKIVQSSLHARQQHIATHVAEPDPKHSRSRRSMSRPFDEIAVLGDEYIAFAHRQVPDFAVGRRQEPQLAKMRRRQPTIPQPFGQDRRQLGVDQQLQAATTAVSATAAAA
ncbi:hypothetical protein CFHF_12540 [Caulobacter flavus]|uniref:Uncharacterized protein n=1 Tax=Caulobacter flavus TaxID=1679497 RepID=A0A2N5CT39_9CAUL|nr:hypothetical protein C1707_24485 [Caulobacter flavus]PLR14799.1 hypothetical protein CFHF_12540 [Caulobacter flavus]